MNQFFGTKQVFNIVCVDLDILPLHVRSQNAGLIVRKSSDQYSFESFEVSPTTEAVIGTKGRLRRCFPGPAVVIGQDRIADANFLKPLAEYSSNLMPRRLGKYCQLQQRHTRRSLRPGIQCTQGSTQSCSPAFCEPLGSRSMSLASTSTHATTFCGRMHSNRGDVPLCGFSFALRCRQVSCATMTRSRTRGTNHSCSSS